MPVVGLGVDVVEVARFDAAVARTPALLDRLFVDAERVGGAASLAARFAAKEAVAKALGGPRTLRWHDVEVVTEPSGRPRLAVRATVADAGADLGIRHWHLSLSHDGGLAVAMVVVES